MVAVSSRGTKSAKPIKTRVAIPVTIQKESCQEKVVLIIVPIGIPMIEAIEKPAKTQETSPARFSRGASWAAKIKTREMIAPDTLAVKIRDKSSDQKPPASAVQVLPTKKMAM